MNLKGEDLIIEINNVVLAGAVSCEIVVSSESIETSSPTQEDWKDFISGRKFWSIKTRHLLSTNGEGLDSSVEMVGQVVNVSCVEKISGKRLAGRALVLSWTGQGQSRSLLKGLFSFQGKGPLRPVIPE